MGCRRGIWVVTRVAGLVVGIAASPSLATSWTDPCEEDPDRQVGILWAETGHLNTTQLVGLLAGLDAVSV